MTTEPGLVEAGCRTFLVFAIGGSLFCFINGNLRGSSKGCRLAGGIQAVITGGPRVRRRAAWRGAETAVVLGIERFLVGGPLNSMVSWGAANALFSLHRGMRVAVCEGVKGVAYGGLLEIALYGLQRFTGSEEGSG